MQLGYITLSIYGSTSLQTKTFHFISSNHCLHIKKPNLFDNLFNVMLFMCRDSKSSNMGDVDSTVHAQPQFGDCHILLISVFEIHNYHSNPGI